MKCRKQSCPDCKKLEEDIIFLKDRVATTLTNIEEEGKDILWAHCMKSYWTRSELFYKKKCTTLAWLDGRRCSTTLHTHQALLTQIRQ